MEIVYTPINSLLPAADIENWIPQKKPFVLLSALYSCKPASVTSGFTVPADHVLVQKGFLQETGILENVAQTMALKLSYENRAETNKPAFFGLLAAITQATITALVPVGKELITEVTVTVDLKSLVVVRGYSYYEDTLVCQRELKLYHTILQEII